MKKRILDRLEQGQGTTLLGKLLLTRQQRMTLLKWTVFTLSFLLLQIVQDVIFSRVTIFGGCADIVPTFLLLVYLLQETSAGALFVMLCCVFRSLCGVTLGPVSLAVLVFSGAVLSALRKNHLWGEVRSVILCCWVGILLHTAVVFFLGVFLGHTTLSRYPETLGGLLGSAVAVVVLYPLVRAIGKIGGSTWKV